MWEEAYANKKLPEEWNKWDNFRSWAITNRYKAEYGYKGEFSPEGCLKAMPNYIEPELEPEPIKPPKKKNNSKKGGKNG